MHYLKYGNQPHISTWIHSKRLSAMCNIGFVLLMSWVIVSCAQRPSTTIAPTLPTTPQELNFDDACSIYDTHPEWLDASLQASTRHQTPIFIYLAFIHQESRFQAEARPRSSNGKRLSSAYGYAQALDGTWKEYQQETGNHRGKRNNFADAVDFIGWYIYRVHISLGLSKWRADTLYLTYHEGIGGYKRGLHNKKPWLLKIANKVEKRAQRYHRQLLDCGIPLYLERDGSVPEQYRNLSQAAEVANSKSSSRSNWNNPPSQTKPTTSSRTRWH